jgi:uncharacterized repeat protein (TIGR03803 family)
MPVFRSAIALGAFSLLAASPGYAQSTTPVISTLAAFYPSQPAGNLIRGPDGAIYGTAAYSSTAAGGVIYRVALDGSSVTTQYQLSPSNDGINPAGGVTLGSDGFLYGTTKFGRSSDSAAPGTVFKLKPDGSSFAVIHRLDDITTTNGVAINVQGAFPEAELTEGSDTYMYGVARNGGANGTGTVFKVSHDGTDFQVLHTFDASRCPGLNAVTVFLYQRTTTNVPPAVSQTGSATYTYSSAVISGQPTGWTTAVPAATSGDFLWIIQATAASTTGTDTIANTEWSAPVQVTTGTGPGTAGFNATVICSYKRASAQPTDTPGAVTFTFASAAWTPGNGWAAGIPDGTDRLWVEAASPASTGATDDVPVSEWSGVIEIVSGGIIGRTLNRDGGSPVGQIVQGANGYLYGVASSGGLNGTGTVWRVNSDGTGFQVLHTFGATVLDATSSLPLNVDGATPLSGVIDGNDGFFYGTTSTGGLGHGNVFAISADGATYTPLHQFDGPTGSTPIGELTLGANGQLYGTTSGGGVNSSNAETTYGTIFSIDRAGTNFTRLYSFDASSVGYAPNSKLIEVATGDLIGVVSAGGKCGGAYGAIFRWSAAGTTYTGDTKCGIKKNNGGGAGGLPLLLLLGGLGWTRYRVRVVRARG